MARRVQILITANVMYVKHSSCVATIGAKLSVKRWYTNASNNDDASTTYADDRTAITLRTAVKMCVNKTNVVSAHNMHDATAKLSV